MRLAIAIIVLYTVGVALAQLVEQEDCPLEGISYLPHPDCTLYIICINGVATETECPRPLYYNPRLEHCDFPENVPECIGGTRPPVNSTTTQVPTPTTTSETEVPTEEPTLPPTSTAAPPYWTLTQCGQTIISDWGIIEYKLNETYDAGELCAFIIQMDTYTFCDFSLEAHGISDNDPNAITIFGLNDGKRLWPIYLGPPNNSSSGYLLFSTFVVIFNTKTNSGTGFRLRFQSRELPYTRTAGENLVLHNNSMSPLSFPLVTTIDSERDLLVISSEGKMITEEGSYIELSVDDEVFPRPCIDYVAIHSFVNGNHSYEGNVCGVEEERKTFQTKGLFIAVFTKVYYPATYLATLSWRKVSSLG